MTPVLGREYNRGGREYPGQQRYFVRPLSLWRSRSGCNSHSAHKIALTERQPLRAQDVIRRRCVKIEIGLGERQKKVLCGEVHLSFAEGDAHISAHEGVDFRGVD